MKVLLFARARDLAGADAVDVELPPGATVADLRRVLGDRYPKLAPLLERSALAVDDEFAGEDVVIDAGAVVALLPPVSGGSDTPMARRLALGLGSVQCAFGGPDDPPHA